MSATTTGYWVDAPGRGSLREVVLPRLDDKSLRLRATFTGISPGTERLVGLGRTPASCHAAMACRGMQGSFSLPVLYGYCFVGVVEYGDEAGRRAFLMRPHQLHAVVPRHELVWLPDDVPDARATLFANLETAQNAVWDAGPCGDERIVVIGAGAVGLLVAFVLAQQHAGEVVVVDKDPARRARCADLPWVRDAIAPQDVVPGSFAHALHASASAEGLQLAIDAIGFEGQVTELSWYGDQPVSLRLGESFHHQRKRICASQVSTIAPRHRVAGYEARTATVLELLQSAELDRLLTAPIQFAQLPASFAELYDGRLGSLCPIVAYN